MKYLPDYLCILSVALFFGGLILFVHRGVDWLLRPTREKMLTETLKHFRGEVYSQIQAATIDSAAYCELKKDEAYLDAKIKELQK